MDVGRTTCSSAALEYCYGSPRMVSARPHWIPRYLGIGSTLYDIQVPDVDEGESHSNNKSNASTETQARLSRSALLYEVVLQYKNLAKFNMC